MTFSVTKAMYAEKGTAYYNGVKGSLAATESSVSLFLCLELLSWLSLAKAF